MVIGVGKGWRVEEAGTPEPADIAAHWDAICARGSLDEPADVYDEYAQVLGA